MIQMINENKGPDTYIRSDVEGESSQPRGLCQRLYLMLIDDDLLKAGEFSIDLYTMPDGLTNKLWDHLVSDAKKKTGFCQTANIQ